MLIDQEGTFLLMPETPIVANNDEALKVSAFFTRHLEDFHGIQHAVKLSASSEPKKGISFKIDENSGLGKEAYNLSVNPKGITLVASAPNGLFYGIQTLIQLMPSSKKKLTEVVFPAVEIKDSPRFCLAGASFGCLQTFYAQRLCKEVH